MAKSRSPRQASLFDREDDAPAKKAAPAKAARSVETEGAEEKLGPNGTNAADDIAEVEPRNLLSPDGPTPPPDLTGKTVYAIDANSLIFQVFHAIPEMTSPRGEPVNAVFGFTRDLLFLLEKKKPDYLFCAFDMSGPTFRHDLYDGYKSQRSEMPGELRPQFPALRRMIAALDIPILELAGYEADDVLATLAQLTHDAGGECYLVTGDKDCRQLITDRVVVYNVRKDLMYDAGALAADWGIRPDQVVDYQAIVGDSVDNVPGIPLIGPKIARELLNKYDSLEGIFEHAGEIAGTKRRENVIAGREQALLSRQLVRLDTKTPIAIDWPAAERRPLNPERALALCGAFGFHRFAEQLRAQVQHVPSIWQGNYRAIDTAEKFASWLPQLAAQPRIAVRIHGKSAMAVQAEITGLAVAWTAGEAWYLPLAAEDASGQLDRDATLAVLRPILEDERIEKISRDAKHDMLLLAGGGINSSGFVFDTMLASYLLDAGERNHTLNELAQRYLEHSMSAPQAASENDPAAVALLATQTAGEEVDVTLRLAPLLTKRLQEEELERLLVDLEIPLAAVLARMERTGIRVDAARLAALSADFGKKVAAAEKEIYALAGHEFNVASPKQLQQVLFTEQKLPALRRTKSGPSTDASVLVELAAQHPLPAKIIEFRQYSKLKNTYVDALPGLVNPRTGRVHTTFQQAVAATGRLGSSDPNLQNIPIRTREGRDIRSAFLPGPADWRLLSADYSQIELRVLAHFSRDETLCAAFERGDDIHTQVAAQVFGVPFDDVTSEMRRRAKAVNFGVLYGQSAFGLANSLDIEQDEAAHFIAAYFERYPGVDRFLAEILEGCRANGYVKTILGRKRAIRGVRPNAPRQRNLPERTAINTVIQGSAADLIKLAMLAVDRRLREGDLSAQLLLQIHDELLFEAPPAELEPLAELVRQEMSSVMKLCVPLVVDVKTGMNWAETEPWSAAGDEPLDFHSEISDAT
ncbi:MAG TPA: DNA polymerase I [Pirellulales bacterium]|nr:DNA polymerase I [Pirellulales bacterium]